ncbi:MAG: DUF4097 family beta strand repeat-containing protein [Pseudomonadota bacterium]
MKTTTLAISLAALLAAAGADAGERIKRTLETGEQPDVHIINAKGDITVAGHDSSRIEIEAELGKNVDRLDVVERGNRVTIEVVYERGRSSKKSYADLEIRVPRRSDLQVEGVASDVDVQDVQGALRIETVSGDIETMTFGGDVEISAVSGDIDVDGNDATGDASIHTVSGDLDINGLAGALKAWTVSGDIDVTDSALDKFKANSTSGDVYVINALTADAYIKAETVSGEVDIHLAGAWSGRIDIKTLNGGINNCFGPKPQRTSRYGPGRTLSFDQGTGGARAEIDTLSGDVDICFD